MVKCILYLLPIITSIQSNTLPTRRVQTRQNHNDNLCTRLLQINNIYYYQEQRINISGIPADMSVHWSTGQLFFTLINEEMKMCLQVMDHNFEMRKININGLGQSTCVDNFNDIVYIATDNGVYKYHYNDSIEEFSAAGQDVMYMAVNNDGTIMFIATWPQNRVQKVSNNGRKLETFPTIPNGHGLTIDTRNNIYFVATKTSYVLKNGYAVPIKIKGLPTDKVNGIFVTKSKKVFAMDESSNLYSIDPDNTSAKYLGSFKINGVNTFVMDSDENVIIGVRGGILKYKMNERNPCPEHDNNSTKVRTNISKKPSRKNRRKTTTTVTTESIQEEEEEEE